MICGPSSFGRWCSNMAETTDETFVVSLEAAEAPAHLLAERLGEAVDTDLVSVSVFESGGELWRVALYCTDAAAADSARRLIADIAGAQIAEAAAIETIARRDWVAASLAGLAPVRAGRFFVHGAHDRAKIPANAIAIEVEAALAFGTGHHGTTRGCLLALDGLLKARRLRRILDIGTGTGVLAIAAAKATRCPVVASDIDRQAVRVAGANARANVGTLVVPFQASGLQGRPFVARGPYDLILANILLAPLQRLAVSIARLAASHGRVVLSGLLPAQANAALAAYRTQGLRLARRIDLEGWTTLVLCRSVRLRKRESPRRSRARGFSYAGPAKGRRNLA